MVVCFLLCLVVSPAFLSEAKLITQSLLAAENDIIQIQLLERK